MARVCEIIAGKSVLTGNNVSHSNRKTRRRFLPNLHNVTLISDILVKSFKLKISTRALRSIDINGGFDNYLLTTSNNDLAEPAQKIKRAIKAKKKVSEVTAEPVKKAKKTEKK